MKQETLFEFGSNQKCILTEYHSGAFDLSFSFGIVPHQREIEEAQRILKQKGLRLDGLLYMDLRVTLFAVSKVPERKPKLLRRLYDTMVRRNPFRMLARQSFVSSNTKKLEANTSSVFDWDVYRLP